MSHRLINEGTAVERWLFNEHDPDIRCTWPTAAAARVIANRLTDCTDTAMGVRSVIMCYTGLLSPEYSTEDMIRRLRALRRAERDRRKS